MWSKDELTQIGDAEEVQVAPRRRDGSLRSSVTVWTVRFGDDLYARSVRGRNGAWFRGVQETHEGVIRGGGVEKDVSFVDAAHDSGVNGHVDDAYRAKYRRYAGRILNSVLTPEARSTTIRIVPRGDRA